MLRSGSRRSPLGTCTRASRPGSPRAEDRTHSLALLVAPSSLPRSRQPSRRPSALPPGASALLPGFTSFAFPWLPAPRQSDLRTQHRERLPHHGGRHCRRRGREGARGCEPGRLGGRPEEVAAGPGAVGEPGSSGKGLVPRDTEGFRQDLNPRPPILRGAGVGRGGQHLVGNVAPQKRNPCLEAGAPQQPAPLTPHSRWRRASPAEQPPRSPQHSRGPAQPPSLLPRPAEPPPLPPLGIYTFHTFVSYYPVHA